VDGQHPPQVDVAQVVGVDEDDVVAVVGEAGVGRDRAGRPEERRLVKLGDPQHLPAVHPPDVVADMVGQVVGVDQHVPDAGVDEGVDPVVEHGPAGDRDQALGHAVRERPQPTARPGRQHQRLRSPRPVLTNHP
jgi:hypothetical protein